jgi:hypothetical protein
MRLLMKSPSSRKRIVCRVFHTGSLPFARVRLLVTGGIFAVQGEFPRGEVVLALWLPEQ